MSQSDPNPAQEKSPHALREERILEYWEKNEIFEKTLKKSAPKGEFVFFEGPPTANGMPGIHHLEARAFKDAIPRFKTMQGFHVRRKGGWDTHGLPVELQVEKELGLKSKKEIEAYGIAAFNQKCKESVWRYTDEWKKFTNRIGYWIDLKNPYVTYHSEYIESLWSIVKKVDHDGLLYKDYKVVPWCPRCGTGLSSHELAQGYQDVKDLSVTVKFELTDEPGTYILAWTTTPWTLPGNVALAVGKDITYIKVKTSAGNVILAKDIFENKKTQFFGEEKIDIVSEITGADLVGKTYKPLFPFLATALTGSEKDKLPQAFKVYAAKFVTTTDGTGIVHTAVMYGQDDFELGTEVNLPKFHLVNEDGTFKNDVGFLSGRFVKEKNEVGKPTLDVDIIDDLKKRGLFFAQENYKHTYPHCWRCKTPLIYYARDSWYIKMSSLRHKLLKENQGINWEPSHIKEGRFGEWLKDVKDWAISRERYWGTPLPIWKCNKCDHKHVIGSIAELAATQKERNSYVVMRHGESVNNLQAIVCSSIAGCGGLTEKGKSQARASADELNKEYEDIDIIITSPLERTKDTARIVAEKFGIDSKDPHRFIVDNRIHEINFGIYENHRIEEYHRLFRDKVVGFDDAPEGGESLADIYWRVAEFLKDIDAKYHDKKILIVTHNTPAWLIECATKGLNKEMAMSLHDDKNFFLNNAEYVAVHYSALPRNDTNELDLHRPYIDKVTYKCPVPNCVGAMSRVKEVMDVWFDSGAMPFAQDHYPFENKDRIDGKLMGLLPAKSFPADFISEAIDQTRGWFYTLHAVSALLGKGKAYKNVICLGHVLDAQGKKMSKSIGNVVEPWQQMNKYGVDALRYFMYSVNQPGESKNYDEKTVDEIVKKVFNLISNVLTFYQLYSNETPHTEISPRKSPHVLDRWIIALSDQLVTNITTNLNEYRLLEPTRDIRDFVADFSQWYVRRSRDRFKGDDAEDRAYALATTRHILLTLAKVLAPFTPFFSEFIYQELRKEGGLTESVHLESWPEAKSSSVDEMVIKNMSLTRVLASFGLEARMKSKINVRQPLATLKVWSMNECAKAVGHPEFVQLVLDEVNVKKIEISEQMKEAVSLDTTLTDELKEEGTVRELIRALQDLRKEEGLNVGDSAKIEYSAPQELQKIIEKNSSLITKTTQTSSIKYVADVVGKSVSLPTATGNLSLSLRLIRE